MSLIAVVASFALAAYGAVLPQVLLLEPGVVMLRIRYVPVVGEPARQPEHQKRDAEVPRGEFAVQP